MESIVCNQRSWLEREWIGLLLVAVAVSFYAGQIAHELVIDKYLGPPAEEVREAPAEPSTSGAAEAKPSEQLRQAFAKGGFRDLLKELGKRTRDTDNTAPPLKLILMGLAVMGLAGAGIGLWIVLIVMWSLGRWLLPKASLLPGRWGVWDIITAVAFYINVSIALSFAIRSLWPGGVLPWGPGSGRLFATAATGTTTVLYLMWTVQRRNGSALRPLGLASDNPILDVIRGAFAYVLVFPVVGAVSLVVYLVMLYTGWDPHINQAIGIFQQAESPAVVAAMAVVIAIIVPVNEEIVFRGFLHTWMRRRLPGWPSIILGAAFFACLHPMMNWPQILILGVMMGYLRERTQSLLPCIVLHVIFNGASVLLLLLMR